MDETQIPNSFWIAAKDILFENYPVSFIIVVLSAYGYFIGRLVYKAQVQKLEEILDRLLNDLRR
jgi:hypothetical protein